MQIVELFSNYQVKRKVFGVATIGLYDKRLDVALGTLPVEVYLARVYFKLESNKRSLHLIIDTFWTQPCGLAVL